MSERAVQRYEDEREAYEAAVEQFRKLSEEYEDALKKDPADATLASRYADLQSRQQRLQDWFQQLNTKRELIS